MEPLKTVLENNKEHVKTIKEKTIVVPNPKKFISWALNVSPDKSIYGIVIENSPMDAITPKIYSLNVLTSISINLKILMKEL